MTAGKTKLGRAAGAVALLVLSLPFLAAFVFRHRPYSPPAHPSYEGRLRLRYTGITGYELSDGKTTVLLDPVVTRPPIWSLPFGALHPDAAASAKAFPKADFILIDHGHYDHAIDMPDIAARTGAVVVGSKSVCRLALARGVPKERVREAVPGQTLTLGSFRVTVARSRHARILFVRHPMEGLTPETARPLWFTEYRQDAALTYHLSSPAGSVWFHPTSTFAPGELAGLTAGTLILGVTGEPWTPAKLAAVAAEAKGARLVLPTHYDNFFQPRERGLALMPLLDLEALRAMAATAFPDAGFAVLGYDETIALP